MDWNRPGEFRAVDLAPRDGTECAGHEQRLARWPGSWLGRCVWIGVIGWMPFAQARAEPFKQPNGDVIELTVVQAGVQAGNAPWFKDDQGFSVVRVSPRYEYAVMAVDGGLKASGIEVGSVDPRQSALPPRLVPAPEFLRQRRRESPTGSSPPSPLPIEIKKEDGAVIRLKLKGSGAYPWYEDEHGYSVVTTVERFEYAVRGPKGRLLPCGILVGSMNPRESGLTPGIQPAVPDS